MLVHGAPLVKGCGTGGANLALMRRIFLGFLVTACGLFPLPAASSSEERAETSWRSETDGSPVATVTGSWSEVGERDRVDFEGVHILGARTSFEARWLSPWVTWTASDPVGFESSGEMSFESTTARTIKIVAMMRAKKKGHPWGQWMKVRYSSRGTSGGAGWGMGTASFVGGKAPPERLRYEWRLLGEVTGVTRLDGSVEVGLSR